MKAHSLIGLAFAVLLANSSWADNNLVGTWKLVSFNTEFEDGAPSRKLFGENPRGYLVYTAQGRQMVLIEAEGRKAATNEQERAALYQSLIAWSGAYRIEGNKHILNVDTSVNPAMVGSERVSEFKMDGDRVSFISPWAPLSTAPGAPISRGVTVWERVK